MLKTKKLLSSKNQTNFSSSFRTRKIEAFFQPLKKSELYIIEWYPLSPPVSMRLSLLVTATFHIALAF
jgi:hypothetical protein